MKLMHEVKTTTNADYLMFHKNDAFQLKHTS